ncbi:hypothetical protein [Ovoidimarina sediminis]|uniref:hypothetical protein n=1 Tax=Ovoidimarina sediminis TaxID=3079856 RepID=UPI00291013B9|nr:hypothetical protein [Rhodophyticola sp. MJ-SS7]MDU8943282.1 hypothetical protein [Rhodophyticola sp. MJ-SS7]
MARALGYGIVLSLPATPGRAHVSEQGFVLLLPTDLYIAGGVATVVLTIALILFLPGSATLGLFRPLHIPAGNAPRLAGLTRWVAAGLLLALLVCGVAGAPDPLANPLPLWVWTVTWIGLVSVQGALFNIWGFVDPFRAPGACLRRVISRRLHLRLPRAAGKWPAVVLLVAFAAFMLADPAPADPRRLALIVALYAAMTVAGRAVFGPRWALQVEFLTVMMRLFASVAPLSRSAAGLWGWRLARGASPDPALAVFAVALLGIGSFDGLNETFWWLGRIGINPLEYPGRSAVIGATLIGLALVLAGLLAAFALSLGAGLLLARRAGFLRAFCAFAPALLPIATGYHIAHYLTSFLVDIQWTLAATSDPLDTGADLLNLGQFYVTTGFFNTRDTVRIIWLTQAGAVVIGHVISILVAHAIALRIYGNDRAALLSQAPLAVLMVLYTLFGLWLLASPRGV